MVKLTKYRIAAFSLVEFIVAMVILLTIFFIGIYFFAGLQRDSFNIQEVQAANTLEDYIQKSKKEQNFSDESIIINGWKVSRKIVQDETNRLSEITFTIFKKDSAGTPLLHRRLLLPAPIDSLPLYAK